MTTLTRRALIGAAGLLETAPLVAEGTAAAPEQYPPDGYTFCETCEGEGWADRFGAVAQGGDHPERLRYDVMEGDARVLYAMACVPGPGGWVAELAPGPPQTDPHGEVWTPKMWPCACGSGAPMIRVSYRDVQLIDHWAERV